MKGNGKTMVVTKAERTLCEEIKGFSKKQTALLNAILEGINIAAREAKVKDLRSSSTIEALKKALYIELYVENNKLIMVYKKPYDVLVFERGKPGEEELSEKELCYMLMIYKEEITKYADRLLGIYNESYILRNISIDLDEIINNYIKS